MSANSNTYIVGDYNSEGVVEVIAGNGITVTGDRVYPVVSIGTPPLYIAQYYKSTSQIVASGSISITFDSTQTWNNANGYITHNGFGSDFVVVRAGIYQVEFALTVTANSTNWNTVRTASINIVRGAVNNAILSQGSHPPTNTDYTLQVVGTLYLLAGDIVRCVHTGINQNGNGVAVRGLLNTFDYNTTFTWTLLN